MSWGRGAQPYWRGARWLVRLGVVLPIARGSFFGFAFLAADIGHVGASCTHHRSAFLAGLRGFIGVEAECSAL